MKETTKDIIQGTIIGMFVFLGIMWLITAFLIGIMHGHLFDKKTYNYSGWEEQKEFCEEKGGIPIRSSWSGNLKECQLGK